MRSLKGVLINVSLSVASLLFMLVVLEGVYRIVFFGVDGVLRPRRYTSMYPRYGEHWEVSPDSDVLCEFIPNKTFYVVGGRFDINSMGFRGREWSPQKKDSFRILVVGDSITMGPGVEFDDLYYTRLERMLNERFGQPHFEVMGMAMVGYGTFQERHLLLEKGRDLNPDMVLVQFYYNDLTDNLGWHNEQPTARNWVAAWDLENKPSIWTRLKARSFVISFLNYLTGLWEHRKSRREWESKEGALAVFDEEVGKLKKVGDDMPSRPEIVFLCVNPLEELRKPNPYWLTRFRQALEILKKHEIQAVDMSSQFLGQNERKYWLHLFDHHPNRQAHAIYARALFDHMVEHCL